jgi:hypothetical protein
LRLMFHAKKNSSARGLDMKYLFAHTHTHTNTQVCG